LQNKQIELKKAELQELNEEISRQKNEIQKRKEEAASSAKKLHKVPEVQPEPSSSTSKNSCKIDFLLSPRPQESSTANYNHSSLCCPILFNRATF
jgi:sRNA-binding protein